MKNQVTRLLIETREFLADEDRWIKNVLALKLTPSGYPEIALPTDPEACGWSASGAVGKIFASWNSPYWGIYKCAISALDMASFAHGSIRGMNDYHLTTHDQILAAFDKAIENLEAKEKAVK